MRLSRRRSSLLDPESIRLPLIALIDVVFFLLFYFVASYSISADESELGTGFATPGPSTSVLQPQIVQVSRNEDAVEFRIGSHVFRDRESLADLLRTLPKEPGVVVRAAPDVSVEATATAVQAGKDAGFTNVRFAITTPAARSGS